MRKIALVLLTVALVAALDVNKFAALLQTGTRDNEAVQSVYELLEDLKTENKNLQAAADQKNDIDEEIFLRVVAELTTISNINAQNLQDAKAFRDSVDQAITEQESYIDFANGRSVEIVRREEELSDQRAYANSLFVKALSDYDDAIDVINLLKNDLSGYMVNGPSELVQVSGKDVAKRLSMYSHLFKEEAIKSFMSLAGADDEDVADRQKGDTIPQKVYNVLLDLEDQLVANIAELRKQEIAALFALSSWLSNSDAEKDHLNDEIAKAEARLEKLSVAQPAAVSSQDRVDDIYADSKDAINVAISDLEDKRSYYTQQNNRRAEENAIIDTVIAIFVDQVRDLVR